MAFKFVFRALRYRNYRLFFTGQTISLIGTWMQQTAMSWLVYSMTHSAFLLGLVGFAGQIPSFFVSPVAGVLIDRWNRHRVLLATQSLSMLQALILALLVLTGTVETWHILLLSLFIGLVNSFDMPTRQAFLIHMVEDKAVLGNAIALNSSMVNVARMVGPTLAGILIATFGEGICFLLNGASYTAVIASLLLMKVHFKNGSAERTAVLKGLREGFSYAFGFAPIKSIILLLALAGLMGMPYMVLMPIFARDVLHGGPHTLGFLMGATGVGALIGAVFLASRKTVIGLGRLIAFASSTFATAIIGFSFSRILWLSLVLLVVAGFGMMVHMASSNTIIQTIVDDDKRGRMMSFFIMALIGMSPLGSLLEGGLASRIGAPNTLLIGGICCLLGSLFYSSKITSLKRTVHPIYLKLGLISERSDSHPF